MYIKDEELRQAIREILTKKSKNSIVATIKKDGEKFHQYTLDNFLNGAPVSLDSLLKLQKYVLENPM